MSSDTAKENASVVDSSLTEWKNDRGNLDDPESPCYRGNEDPCRPGADDQAHSCDQVGTSKAAKYSKLYDARYFIMKSLNHQNIKLSIDKGIWATQVMNEPILEEAFHNSYKVILIFSVNMSGFFQGYAQMMSSVGWRRDNVWSQGNGGRNPWGRSFKVKWLRLHDLPFQKTLHLKNPLNDYKPVKISRDCQELPPDIGEALCELLDGKNDVDVNLKRRPYMETTGSLVGEDFNLPLMHTAPVLCPSLLYQHQTDTSRFHIAHPMPTGTLLREDSAASGTLKVKQSKKSQVSGNTSNLHVDHNACSRFGIWGSSAERSTLASTLTEDDILEMTYEEYLEAHSRGNKRIFNSASGPSREMLQSSISKETLHELHMGCSPSKRTRHQSLR